MKINSDRSIILFGTKEMRALYWERTIQHIQKVERALLTIDPFLTRRAFTHDQTKLHFPEALGYLWMTEFYRCKRVGEEFEKPSFYNDLTKMAWDHHKTHNDHHPDYWDRLIDMPAEAIHEMVADWWAMSEELGGTARGWFETEFAKKHDFSCHQLKLINQDLKILEGQSSTK